MAIRCTQSANGVCAVTNLIQWARVYDEGALRAWESQTGQTDEYNVLSAGAEAGQIQDGVGDVVNDLLDLNLCKGCPNGQARRDFILSRQARK